MDWLVGRCLVCRSALQDRFCGNWGIFLRFSLFSPEISPQRLCARFPFFPIFSVVSGESGEKIGYFSLQINYFPKNVPFFATLSPRFSTPNSPTSPESLPRRNSHHFFSPISPQNDPCFPPKSQQLVSLKAHHGHLVEKLRTSNLLRCCC